MNGQAGKGDTYRKVDPRKWAEGYARAFGPKTGRMVLREKRGQVAKRRRPTVMKHA